MAGPQLSLFGIAFFQVPAVQSPAVFLPILIATSVIASWPWYRRDAPYSFWILACALFVVAPLVVAL